MDDRRHPLPWSTQNGWVSLAGNDPLPNLDRCYRLALGHYNKHLASFTADDLRELRDRIDAALNAPYRVLIPNPREHGAEWLASTIRQRLDQIHQQHPRIELAMLDVDLICDNGADAWAMDAQVRVLVYQTVEEMVADGGNVMLLVAGEHGPDLAGLASEADIPIDLIREAAPAAKVPS